MEFGHDPLQWRTDWVLVFNAAHAHQISKVVDRLLKEDIHSVVCAKPGSKGEVVFVLLMLKDRATLERQAAKFGHKVRMCLGAESR